MLKIKRILILVGIILFSTVNIPLAISNELKEIIDCDETMDCFSPLAPPNNALKMKYIFQQSPLIAKRPNIWPVRAIYLGNNDIFEFDKKGNVLIAKGKPTTGYMVEMIVEKTNRPLWEGTGRVYYWYNPEQDLGVNYNSKDLLTSPQLRLIFENNRVCYGRPIADEYSYFILKESKSYLDGDCAKSIQIEINGKEFITYPEIIKLVEEEKAFSYTYYWNAQYFDDPISPIYNLKGKCIYYCDLENNKK